MVKFAAVPKALKRVEPASMVLTREFVKKAANPCVAGTAVDYTKTPTLLQERYPCPRDATIFFDEEPHDYYVDFENAGEYSKDGVISVTGFIKAYFDEFDEQKQIPRSMAKAKRDGESNRYFGMSYEAIAKQWEDTRVAASRMGNEMHQQIEFMYNGFSPVGPLTKEYLQFTAYQARMEKDGYLPFRTEWRLRTNREHKLTGTIDMLYIHRDPAKRMSTGPDGKKTLHLYMADWKCAKQIKKEGAYNGSRGRGPCSHLENVNFNKYALQLNTYKYMVENEAWYNNLEVDGVVYANVVIDFMCLVVMHPVTRTAYGQYEVPDMQDVVGQMFDRRRAAVQKSKSSSSMSGATVLMTGGSDGQKAK